ncbi:MAG: LysR family transcriptional regulator [Candidatus Eisenbacteria sp.]|nr:LysR family transcriptional regulator [Candidatus Eisenbacteria bacterium]
MDLAAMRTFVQAVRMGSLSEAARAGWRTQPAVTAQIQKLEREVGDLLLVRAPRGVRPTPTGEILYARAQEILRQTDELLDELRAGGSLQRGELRIGATDTMALGVLPPVLAGFRRRHPGIRLAVDVRGSRALSERVVRGELDLALVTLPSDHPELEGRELHREQVVFVAAPDHPLARRRLRPAEIARLGVIHYERASVTREEVAAVFRVQGLELPITMEVSSPEAIKALVAAGLGIAPLALSQVSEAVRSGGLVRLRVTGFRCWRRSGVVRRRSAPLLRAVRAFLQMLPRRAGRRAGRLR